TRAHCPYSVDALVELESHELAKRAQVGCFPSIDWRDQRGEDTVKRGFQSWRFSRELHALRLRSTRAHCSLLIAQNSLFTTQDLSYLPNCRHQAGKVTRLFRDLHHYE